MGTSEDTASSSGQNNAAAQAERQAQERAMPRGKRQREEAVAEGIAISPPEDSIQLTGPDSPKKSPEKGPKEKYDLGFIGGGEEAEEH